MAWESALDRLLLKQINQATKGEVRPEDVGDQVVELVQLAPDRPESAFHLGYARSLLGIDLPDPEDRASHRRWYTFGRMRGHDRQGERNWVADLLNDSTTLLELLREPKIASQCLPVVMRTLFWCGNLDVAIRAIEYLSTTAGAPEHSTLVDAALVDLLGRLERRADSQEEESTQSILQKAVDLACFDRLPSDVRAGYYKALANRMLAVSEFSEALDTFECAFELAPAASSLQSKIALGGALAVLRHHEVEEVAPRAERPERDEALAWLARIPNDCDQTVPEASFLAAMLDYEQGNYAKAAESFDLSRKKLRRESGRDASLRSRTDFFIAAALLAGENRDETSRALRLMDSALETVRPDLESFYYVHEALKDSDRKLALRFLDSVDISRGTTPDQLLFVALEYLSLGEAEPASSAATRVLQVAVDLDQRIEAMRVLLTAHNMQGEREKAREVYQDMRELLLQRGRFGDLENLLKNEDFVGQALDHVEMKCELVALYEEMEDREFEKASLQTQIARSLRARKDEESLRQALGVLQEVDIAFPDLARDEIESIGKLLELSDVDPAELEGGAGLVDSVASRLGHTPRILVVGGNERQRRHHPRFESLAAEWGFTGEWLMANYSSPQRLVGTIGDRIDSGIDLLILLHWNRHETTEPALELARKAGVPARTVHYAGFTSLQVSVTDMLEKIAQQDTDPASTPAGKSGGKRKAKSRS